MDQNMPPSPPVPRVQPGPLGLDCSPEAQALRWQRLRDLEGNFYGSAAQVSDRGRQVTFKSRGDMGAAIAALRDEIAACSGTGWPRRRSRMFYVPQVKDL